MITDDFYIMSEVAELTISDLFHTSWDAFSQREKMRLLRTVQVIRSNNAGRVMRGYMIKNVLRKVAKSRKTVKKLDAEQVVDIYHELTFLHKPWFDFVVSSVTLSLSNGKKGVFSPPKEKLADLSYYQWKWLDAKYTKFLVHAFQKESDQAKTEFGKFLACLYTIEGPPSKGVAEGRGMFHEDHMSLYGEKLYRKFSFWERDLILETYANIRAFIIDRHPYLFPSNEKPSKGEATDQAEQEGPWYTGHMWSDMHYDLADTEAFKGYIAAGEANIYDALGYLNKKAEEQLKSKEK